MAKKNKYIPCLLEEQNDTNAHDFSCGYGSGITCDECIVNDGNKDPRIED
jgi:hypothetical protein